MQWIALKIGGYTGHKRMVKRMNYCLIQSLKILGNTCTFTIGYEIPKDKPLIIVSNHQSTYDISPIQYYLDDHHVKFVSKVELAKGIPSVSFNLRHGGSVLIDRKNPRQALPAMKQFAEYLEANKYAGVIFPEGTRSKNGIPKSFSPNGLKTLIKYMPSAYIVPVTINNSWKIIENGYRPMNIGIRATWQTHKPIEVAGRDFDELLKEVEDTIKGAIIN